MTSKIRRHGLAWATFLCAVFGASVIRAQDNSNSMLTEIWSRWRDRQSAVDTARLTWMYKRSLSPEAMAQLIASSKGGRTSESRAAGLTMPESQSSFVLAQDRVRYESIVASFADGEQGVGVPHISAFDGRVQQYLTDRTGRPNQRGHGTIGNYVAFDEWMNVDLLPLGYALRPLRPEIFGSDPGRWRVDSRAAVIDGRDCVVISSTPPDTPPEVHLTNTAYLDSKREFVPLRVTFVEDGHLGVQMDMHYEREGRHFWVPSSWTSTSFSREKGIVRNVSEIRRVEVTINEPVPDGTFRIEFPPGTVVTDKRKSNQEFIVQDNGDWKLYDPRTVIAAEHPWRMMPWFVGAAICLLAGLGFVWWRRSMR